MYIAPICKHCGEVFDLNSGYISEKWYPGIMICKECYEEEKKMKKKKIFKINIDKLVKAFDSVEIKKAPSLYQVLSRKD